MKILKIDNDNGYFSSSKADEWTPIDKIDKESLMKLLNLFLENDVEIDSPEEHSLSNEAHLLIYKSVYAKFKALEENKAKFTDEADRTYLTAIQKYSAS